MFFKKISKNCYFCVNELSFIYGRLLGFNSLVVECSHKNSKNFHRVEDSLPYKALALFIFLTLSTFCAYGLFNGFYSREHGDFHFYSKILITNSITCVCFSNVLLFLLKMKYRKAQLEGITKLLQNGKFYNVPTLITYEAGRKLRRWNQVFYVLLTACIFFLILYYSLSSNNLTIVQIIQRHSIIASFIFYLVFSYGFVIESCTYQEILYSCSSRIKISLENHYNYQAIQDNLANEVNFKYLCLEQQLVNLRKLYLAITDNIKLYFNFISPIITINVPCFIFFIILTMYATIKIVLAGNISQSDREYFVVLLCFDLSIAFISVNMRFTEKIKKPVSHLIINSYNFLWSMGQGLSKHVTRVMFFSDVFLAL